MTEQTNAVNDLLTNDEIKILVADMTALYAHPDNANKFSWFIESFIGAVLLHPHCKTRVNEIMTKFNQQLEHPLSHSEKQTVYEQLERRLRDELSTN